MNNSYKPISTGYVKATHDNKLSKKYNLTINRMLCCLTLEYYSVLFNPIIKKKTVAPNTCVIFPKAISVK